MPLQLAGINDPGYNNRSLIRPIYGRGYGVGRGEIVGEGGGVRCGGGVGRGGGVSEFVRGVGVGRVDGAGEPQCGLHKKPPLYCVRVLT